MEWGLKYILACEVGHFLLAFFAGLLAWLSISTIYYRLYSTPLSGHYTFSKDISSRFRLSAADLYILLFSLSVALLSHVLEDYYFSIV